MFKVGDEVVCVNGLYEFSSLTEGKKYTVIRTGTFGTDKFVAVKNDKGKEWDYSVYRFEAAEPDKSIREEIISVLQEFDLIPKPKTKRTVTEVRAGWLTGDYMSVYHSPWEDQLLEKGYIPVTITYEVEE